MNSWGVIGGGFGLYGYLPALAKLGDVKVFIPERHQQFICSRQELRGYIDQITFVETYKELIAQSGSIILSVPPRAQQEYLDVLSNQKYKFLLLEKPIAPCPASAYDVFEKATQIASSVRIGYIFGRTAWGSKLLETKQLALPGIYKISWLFCAHHFKVDSNSWKRFHADGGGVLRFYGIQIIALLREMGNFSVVDSKLLCKIDGNPYKWEAIFSFESKSRVCVEVDSSSSREKFEISKLAELSESIVDQLGPFENESNKKNDDARVSSLLEIIGSFKQDNHSYYSDYKNINLSWDEVEQKSKWISD